MEKTKRLGAKGAKPTPVNGALQSDEPHHRASAHTLVLVKNLESDQIRSNKAW